MKDSRGQGLKYLDSLIEEHPELRVVYLNKGYTINYDIFCDLYRDLTREISITIEETLSIPGPVVDGKYGPKEYFNKEQIIEDLKKQHREKIKELKTYEWYNEHYDWERDEKSLQESCEHTQRLLYNVWGKSIVVRVV